MVLSGLNDTGFSIDEVASTADGMSSIETLDICNETGLTKALCLTPKMALQRLTLWNGHSVHDEEGLLSTIAGITGALRFFSLNGDPVGFSGWKKPAKTNPHLEEIEARLSGQYKASQAVQSAYIVMIALRRLARVRWATWTTS